MGHGFKSIPDFNQYHRIAIQEFYLYSSRPLFGDLYMNRDRMKLSIAVSEGGSWNGGEGVRVNMDQYYYYHVVTEKPMHLGQHIIFDETHRSGVYERVMAKSNVVSDIYQHPEKYEHVELEHHVKVALRELALEKVRKRQYSNYPSRLSSLYVSKKLVDAKQWAELFVRLKRPTYQIVKLKVLGKVFTGDANNCFEGTTRKEENMKLAERYWNVARNRNNEPPIWESLVSGDIEVIEIVEEINKNIVGQ